MKEENNTYYKGAQFHFTINPFLTLKTYIQVTHISHSRSLPRCDFYKIQCEYCIFRVSVTYHFIFYKHYTFTLFNI